jgi:hypothetical protein
LKLQLHKLLDGINDDSILRAIHVLLTQKKDPEKKDWYDDLPEAVKKRLHESMEQAERGETIPHEEVMQQFQQKYPQLRFR